VVADPADPADLLAPFVVEPPAVIPGSYDFVGIMPEALKQV
jgi:hypothetical protein